jgi:threonylcarbamoyladenosine tRNA methylthiotransferase MtaB
MLPISFQIYSLGCKVSYYDAAVLRRELERHSFVMADRATKPSLVVVNTCAVTASAITKDRQLIKKLRREFPLALLVIMGCWPETHQTAKEEINDEKTLFWGVGQPEKLIKKIREFFPEAKKIKANGILESGLIVSSERSRYFIKIGDGCNQFCSYCLIPLARGRLKSRPSAVVLTEIKAAVCAGYREIVLSGIHLGRYGEDQPGQEINLVALLKKILKIENLGRVRLSSIEVTEVTPALIKLMKENKKICRHLHISLQSGSDRILKLMNRPYTTTDFYKRTQELRKALPEIAISTDIIVGFPGENAADFEATYEFAKKIKFSKIHVFSFSAHAQTRAFKMAGKVSPQEIKERSTKLRKLSEQLEADYQKKILDLYKKGGLSLVVEKGGADKTRVKTEFGFDLYLSPRELKKHFKV